MGQHLTAPSFSLSLTLEIAPDNDPDPDPVAVYEASNIIVEDLQQAGYIVKPLSTGKRGGLELLFQVIITTMQAVSTDVLAQKDAIDVISALCAIFATISPLISHLFHTKKKRSAQGPDIKVSLKIDEAEIEIMSPDIDDERIVQLAKRFLDLYPTTKVTQSSAIKVRGCVSKRKPRQRR